MRTSRAAAAALALVSTAMSAAAAAAVPEPRPLGDQRPTHSSDGMAGPELGDVAQARGTARATTVDPQTWQVAPGLSYSTMVSVQQQGPVRLHVLTATWNQAGLTLDQVSGPAVTSRAPLTRWLSDDHDIAGVNADFFDITDTGAPLGVGVDRQSGLLQAPRSGWNNTFYIGRHGTPHIGRVALVARVVRDGRTVVTLGGLNLPHVAPNAINAYTPAWGRTAGRQVVDGASRVRQVHVLNNVVRTNRVGATSGVAVTGQILVGRGQGAITLRGLEVGQKVRVASALSVQSPQVAISGSAQLMRAGKVVTADNGELHPRTAVGIDRDKGLIHLLVADGRSPSSAGLTLRQLADVMNGLGDEDVLNLDGGGSSTLVAPNHTGLVGVRNTPSDGHERAIPNGLGFRYTAPQAGWMSPDAGAGER